MSNAQKLNRIDELRKEVEELEKSFNVKLKEAVEEFRLASMREILEMRRDTLKTLHDDLEQLIAKAKRQN